MTEQELKPCPFCNGRPTMTRIVEEFEADNSGPAGEHEAYCEVRCDYCGCGIAEEYRADAVKAWNRRGGKYAPEGTFSERLEQAINALEDPQPMEVELWAAGADQDTAEFVARMLAQHGFVLANLTEPYDPHGPEVRAIHTWFADHAQPYNWHDDGCRSENARDLLNALTCAGFVVASVLPRQPRGEQ